MVCRIRADRSSAIDVYKRQVLRITSDNNIVIDVIAKLLKELFDIEVINKSPMMIPEDDFIRIGEGLRMTADIQDVYLTLIKSSCCKKAFLRGAFLCNGSVNTPERCV